MWLERVKAILEKAIPQPLSMICMKLLFHRFLPQSADAAQFIFLNQTSYNGQDFKSTLYQIQLSDGQTSGLAQNDKTDKDGR